MIGSNVPGEMKVQVSQPPCRVRPWVGVWLLFVLYSLSFTDRGVLNLLVGPIRDSLNIDDVGMSLLLGASFSIFYAIVSLPLARVADLSNRRNLIVAGVLLWSACTIATAFAESFWMLASLRAGLALGEATLCPATYSMIADWFSPRKRDLPTTVYTWAGGLGTSLGVILMGSAVGFIVEKNGLADTFLTRVFEPWQVMFLLVGIPTLLMGILFALVVREPQRVFHMNAADQHPTLREVMGYVRQHRKLWTGLLAGLGLGNIGYVALMIWAPQIVARNYGWEVSRAAVTLGILSSVTSVLGYVVLPYVSRLLRDRMQRPDIPLLFSIALSLISNLLMAAAAIAPSPIWFFACYGLGIPLLIASSILSVTSIPIIAPPRMRAVLTSVYLILASAVCQTIAPTAAALLGEHVFSAAGARGLGMGVAVLSLLTPLISVTLLLNCRRAYASAVAAGLQFTEERSSEGERREPAPVV